jgi:hypothetical protein
MLLMIAGCQEEILPTVPEVTEATEATELVEVEDSNATDTTDRWLISPPAGAAVPQNVQSLGCPAHPYRGYGFALRFDWKDATHARGSPSYEIVVEARTAVYAAVQTATTESEWEGTFCNGFVIDRNLNGWEWKVTARAANGDVLWTEAREFRFEPCRHPGGVPCTAPVGS